ncbi:type II toxin-antitoxin system Phd/YefM family antitoxin [Chamaesiphon sp.]|uniref:type II toxin-antitoxin system Phd/YefM family antitoxin n=1 Tax=Chamaesiphon sp. TaxID=2814140 RepID=UPI003594642A
MHTYTLSEARNRHGEIFDRAATEPVLLTKQSRPSHVLLSATAYTKLIDKLTELEDAVWGQKATEVSKAEMVGTEVFTNALTKIANGEA